MGFLDSLFGGGGDGGDRAVETQYDVRPAPEYAEASGARGKWWESLQQWGGQPGYGAIAPNWGDIWNNARGKLQRQYWGGPEGPGAVAKVRANSARRGVADQTAGDANIARLGMQEGNQIADMAIQQAIAEASFGEQGRTTWLSSLQNLAGLKPQMVNYGSRGTNKMIPNPVGDLVGGVGSLAAVGGLGGGGGEGGGFDLMGIFNSIMGGGGGMGDMFGGGQSGVNTGDSGLGDSEDEGYDWLSALIGGGRALMGDPGGYAQVAGTFM